MSVSLKLCCVYGMDRKKIVGIDSIHIYITKKPKLLGLNVAKLLNILRTNVQKQGF